MAEKWIPLPGSDARPINVEVAETDGDGCVTRYRVWPAGYPEPPGNPVKWSPETLRRTWKPESEGE